MPVTAITPDYEKHVEFRDVERNFHGNRLVYIHWEEHLSFCSAMVFPLPPVMPFTVFIEEVVKPHYAPHPDAAHIDWSKVVWTLDGKDFTPDLQKSLDENGVRHKSLLRFWTPGLTGYKGSAN